MSVELRLLEYFSLDVQQKVFLKLNPVSPSSACFPHPTIPNEDPWLVPVIQWEVLENYVDFLTFFDSEYDQCVCGGGVQVTLNPGNSVVFSFFISFIKHQEKYNKKGFSLFLSLLFFFSLFVLLSLLLPSSFNFLVTHFFLPFSMSFLYLLLTIQSFQKDGRFTLNEIF